MRIAILSDLHANLEATNAVLGDAHERDCTQFVCLGDVVGYNANPRECLEITTNRPRSRNLRGISTPSRKWR
jgi:predicted phosphodiesterase